MKKTVESKFCVCIGDKDFKACNAELGKTNFAEIRGDLCALSTKELERLLESNRNVIFTYRFGPRNEKKAMEQILCAIDKNVAFVDIDISAPARCINRVKRAISHTKLILSYHDFNGTPTLSHLKKIVEECKKRGADIVKIITTAQSLSDASTIMQLYHTLPKNVKRSDLIAFAMGESGRITRIASLYLGAPFTYCSAKKATADGQFSKGEMIQFFLEENFPFEIPTKEKSNLFSKYGTTASRSPSKSYNSSITIPCAKSIAQRAIIAAAIAEGESILRNYEPCADTQAAIAFARQAGCNIVIKREGERGRGEKMLVINSPGIAKWRCFRLVNTRESGLLTRMLIPLLAYLSSIRNSTAITSKITITGEGTLLKRDLSVATSAMRRAGAYCKGRKQRGAGEYLPITIGNGISAEQFTISGAESSQSVTGYLMMLPLLSHETHLSVTNPTSRPYIELTIKILKVFGIKMEVKRSKRRYEFTIPGGQSYGTADFFMNADWSSASNFVVAGAIASASDRNKPTFTVKRMPVNSPQADEKIIEFINSCGARTYEEFPSVVEFQPVGNPQKYKAQRVIPTNLRNIVISATKLKSFKCDATDAPDLIPILVALAVYCSGTSRISGVGRLAQKESNRAEAIILEFTKMGYNVAVEGDTLVVKGLGGRCSDSSMNKIFCSSHNDHRIAMALIIATLFRNTYNKRSPAILIDNVACIEKSFPTFIHRLQLNNIKP